ncbi:MAG TPA: DUF460 domain-containing protein [Candidatus Nanoarchaeia archaeon]|nr:DUF460 domain-containing protein [Candidatus Nanoarchaeia archaeon]
MVDKELLVIGIDPGTTVGYAVLDINGNIVQLGSEKDLDLSSLISKIIQWGMPLIVAGDKQHTSDFVEKAAVKLGSRLICPEYDLKVVEKREMAQRFSTKNQHEIDAVAAALFALKKLSPLLHKIDVFVEHYGKKSIRNQLIHLVVGKELNIKDAAEFIEGPDEAETKIIKEVIEEHKLNEKSFLTLFQKYKQAKKELQLLSDYNGKLMHQLETLRKDYEYMFHKIRRSQTDKRMQSLLDFKEQRIKSYDGKLRKKDADISTLQDDMTTLLFFLSNLHSHMLLKKLDNLGIVEYEKKKSILNIGKQDILLVKDPDIVSDKVIAELKGSVSIILHKKPISSKIAAKLPFIFIGTEQLQIDETEYFGLITKAELDKARSKQELLSKIVSDYRRERA